MLESNKSNGFGIAALVLSIIGILLFFTGVSFIFSILAITFSIIQKKRYSNGIATTGLVLGIIGGVLSIAYALIVLFSIFTYFKPSNIDYGKSRFVVSAPFYANSSVISARQDNINLGLENKAGENYIIKSIIVSGNGQSCLFNSEQTIQAGEIKTFTVNGESCKFNNGDEYQGNIIIEYSREGQTQQLTTTGFIQGVAS